MPKSHIFSMFGASPVRPLQQHMAKVQATVVELIPFFDAVFAEAWPEADRLQQQISDLEAEADRLKKELRLHLPSGWLMAMSRRDLLEVLTTQDRLANKAKDIAGLVRGRHMIFEADMQPRLRDFVKRSVDASAQAQRAINELDELVETGFRGGEVRLVESMLRELDAIESDTDTIQVEIRAQLFAREKEMHPVDVMFLYRVFEWIGDLGNEAQRVGSRLQLMLAR